MDDGYLKMGWKFKKADRCPGPLWSRDLNSHVKLWTDFFFFSHLTIDVCQLILRYLTFAMMAFGGILKKMNYFFLIISWEVFEVVFNSF